MAIGPEQAVFILGIEHRSGTNFLSDLLALHEDCCRPASIGEDFLVHHAEWLEKYVKDLRASWNPEWRKSASHDDIGAALGRGLLSVLSSQADRPRERLVTKTPRANHISLFPWLFPDHPLLIIIRDGRSLVESAVRSFGWTYAKAIERWARGAKSVLEFDRDQRGGACRYLVVRYEDLVTDLESQMRRIFAFLRLDAARYDFEAAASLPVRGSSILKSEGQDLHWKPMAKSAKFNPLSRADHWTASQHREFYCTAGHFQQLLGYSVEGSVPNGIWGGMMRRLAERRSRRRIARWQLKTLQPQTVETEHEAMDVLPFRPARRAA